jgi:CubicO group peptidase (beta-lactamase class C family)
VEKGKLSLDDTIAKHLPSFPNKEAASIVTVRQLLAHRSGLKDYFNDKFMKASREQFREIKDFLPLFANEPLSFTPGSEFRYSNAGYIVLGAIVEAASGQDYFEYIRENIYKPAGMINSDCFELDRETPNLATGYTRDPSGAGVRNNLFLHVIKGGPAGGGYSTVEDLFRFGQALRQGKLIREETLKQWTTPATGESYALGFEVEERNGVKSIGHGGGFPGINSMLRVELPNGYTVAVMSNIDNGVMPVRNRLEVLKARLEK